MAINHSWTDRPCLVTGGAGFGGAHLCGRLRELGARVHVLDRALPRTSYLVLEGLANDVDFIPGDVRDLELLRLTLERHQIDTVFHLAAQPIAPLSNVLPYETLSVNALGTYAVLEAMRTTTCAKRMVFASSGAYYGTTTTDKPITEDDAPSAATNVYAPSKIAADVAVRTYANVYGIKAAVCRFMNTFGPGDTNFSRIVPRAIKNLLEGAAYEFGDRDDGTTRLDYLYIADMAQAYIRLAERLDDVSGEAFNFGRGRPVSTMDMARLVGRVFDGQERAPVFRGAPRQIPITKSLDIAKAKRLLGWQPTTTLEQGIGETVAWYRRFLDQL